MNTIILYDIPFFLSSFLSFLPSFLFSFLPSFVLSFFLFFLFFLLFFLYVLSFPFFFCSFFSFFSFCSFLYLFSFFSFCSFFYFFLSFLSFFLSFFLGKLQQINMLVCNMMILCIVMYCKWSMSHFQCILDQTCWASHLLRNPAGRQQGVIPIKNPGKMLNALPVSAAEAKITCAKRITIYFYKR